MARKDLARHQDLAGAPASAAQGSVVAQATRGLRAGSIVAASVLGLALILGQHPAYALEENQAARHPFAASHMPPFITPPGETDILLVVMALVLIGAVLAVGVFFFWLHSLPERLVHNSTKVHFDIVAALGLLSLFTHIHLFWVVALLLALVKIPMPNFSGLLGRIAGSLEKIAATAPGKVDTQSFAAPERANRPSLPSTDPSLPGTSDFSPPRKVTRA